MGWIGVDLDGTLAHWDRAYPDEIGAPIPAMVERVKKWLAEGREVRIFTSRVETVTQDVETAKHQAQRIVWWCRAHLGRVLPVTCSKDFECLEIWDDRAVSVERNTGRMLRCA